MLELWIEFIIFIILFHISHATCYMLYFVEYSTLAVVRPVLLCAAVSCVYLRVCCSSEK